MTKRTLSALPLVLAVAAAPGCGEDTPKGRELAAPAEREAAPGPSPAAASATESERREEQRTGDHAAKVQSMTVVAVHPELEQIVGTPATGGQLQTVLLGPQTKITRHDAPDRALELRDLSPGDHVLVRGMLRGDRVVAERLELLEKPPGVGGGPAPH